jgi:hypothetical protein
MSLEEPSRPIDFERLGLSLYLEPDPLLIDRIHSMLLIRQTYIIEGEDGTYVLRYRGRNETKHVSRVFRDGVVGDSAADSALMHIEITDKRANTPIRPMFLRDEPYEKIVEIVFSQPVPPGGVFDIELRCVWRGTFTRQDDYVFFPVHYYKHGVQRLVGELSLAARPSYVEGVRFDGKRLGLEQVQPRIRRRGSRFLVTWEPETPKYIYMLRFGRGDVQNDSAR